MKSIIKNMPFFMLLKNKTVDFSFFSGKTKLIFILLKADNAVFKLIFIFRFLVIFLLLIF